MTVQRATREALIELLHSELGGHALSDVVGVHMGLDPDEGIDAQTSAAIDRETRRVIGIIKAMKDPGATP